MADRTLITTGMKCPRPLFEVHKNMKNLEGGQTIEVHADDPAFKLDIEAWCRRTGNTLVDLRLDGCEYIATIEKT